MHNVPAHKFVGPNGPAQWVNPIGGITSAQAAVAAIPQSQGASRPFKVIDIRTGSVQGQYDNVHSARRSRDRLDEAYGAVNYSVRCFA